MQTSAFVFFIDSGELAPALPGNFITPSLNWVPQWKKLVDMIRMIDYISHLVKFFSLYETLLTGPSKMV